MKVKKYKPITASNLKKQIPGLTIAKMKKYLSIDDIHLTTILTSNQQRRIRIKANGDPDIQLAKKNRKLRESRRKDWLEKRKFLASFISTPMGGMNRKY